MTTDGTDRGVSRRTALRGIGTATTAGLVGGAGCLGLGGSDATTLAYMPIYPDMQYFVMSEEGYLDEIDADLNEREFTDGPSIVQAYASGDIDVAMFGIVPALIVLDRGIEARVTTTNIVEPMLLLAHEDFLPMYEEMGADAFAEWERQTGAPFEFGTFPEGSTPDILLRYWLIEEQGLTPGEDVEITGMGGASAVQSNLASGNVDGTSIMEPVPTRLQASGEPYGRLAVANEFMPGQPAAVTLMNDEVRDSDVGQQFVEQHVRATEFIRENPDQAARHASTVIGEGSLPVDIAQKAMQSPGSNFVSDPREIENGTEIFVEYARELGQIDERLSIDQIFDYSLYESVTG